MHNSRVILLFGYPCRIGLHTLILEKTCVFLIWCIAATSLFTLCLVLAKEGDMDSLVRVIHEHYLMGRL